MSRTIAIISSMNMNEGRLVPFKDEFEQIAASLRLHEPDWEFMPYRSFLREYPQDLDAIDGVVFSGSPTSVNATEDWVAETLDFIRKLAAIKKPMAGMCFGHQAIAKALGGQVGSNPHGWSLGAVPVSWHNCAAGMEPARADLHLYALHNEQVRSLPEGATLTASSEGCPIAGFRIGSHIMTTQHHPEMPNDFVGAVLDVLEEAEYGITPTPEQLSQARISLKRKVDSPIVMRWMAQLLAGPGKAA